MVAGLLALLKDTDRDVRYSAAAALGQLGQGSDAVVVGLLGLLQDNSFSSRTFKNVNQEAARSLVTLSKQSDGVKLALVNWIQQHQQEDFVGVGVDALWEMVR